MNIGFLLILPLFALAGLNGRGADNDTTKVYSLEEVTVNASRVPLELGQSARIVTILDSAAIAASPAETVNDLLKYTVGVDVRQRGALGAQTDISMRGGTFDQISILLNGVNICDPQTGHNAADFPVDMSEIERIEILEGPVARIYGSSSLVGAVNVVTKTAARSGGSVHLEGGSFGYFNGGAGFSYIRKNISNQISGSWTRSDGWSRSASGALNGDFKAAKAFYQGRLTTDQADVSWHFGLSDKDFGSNTFYSARYDEQFEHTFKTFAAVQAETKGWLHFRPVVYWNRSDDRFELFRDDPSAVPFNYHRTNVWGVDIGSWFETFLGKTALGAQMRNEDIESTNLGEPLSTPHGHYVVGLNRSNISLYLEHNLVLKRFTLSAGFSAVENTGNDEGFKFYPGVDASWKIGDNWKLYASYGSSLRMPTFTELYYSVGGHSADKNLKAEKMQSVEGGLKYLRTGVSATASVFYHHGTDMIDWIRDVSLGDDAVWQSVNYTTVNTLGEEVSLRFDIVQLLGREDFFLRKLNLGYAHLNQDKNAEANIQSRYALEYLRNKVTAAADFHLWRNLLLNLSWRYIDREGSWEKFSNGGGTGELVSYEPYSVTDLKLSWTTESYGVYVSVDNLFGKTYYDHGNIPQKYAWVKAGLIWNISL